MRHDSRKPSSKYIKITLQTFFTFNKIDELYSHLERGYSQNFRPTLVHSMERLLGIIIINYKQRYLEL